MIYPENLSIVISYLLKVPGISERAAERAALLISRLNKVDKEKFINSIKSLPDIRPCRECGLPTEGDLCPICSDPSRDNKTICVVEEPRDAVSIEKLNRYNGLYHVLGGVISPLEDIGPEKLSIKKLLERIKNLKVKKVIIALNPTVEGEATATFLLERLKNFNVKTFKIAYGIPYGGTIDMADNLTLERAFDDMKLINGGMK